MAQQASLEPGNPLYELAQTVDLSRVPEKLVCKNCTQFLLNAFKAACCEGSLCENCNSAAAGSACPLCKHDPLISNPSKALRGTARVYLKTLEKAEASRPAELSASIPPPETQITPSDEPQQEVAGETVANGHVFRQETAQNEAPQAVEENADTSGEVAQAIEGSKEMSRRATIDSTTSGNEPDDDIEINVGEYDLSQIPESRRDFDEEGDQWYGEEQSYHQEKPRREQMRPNRQDRNSGFAADNSAPDVSQHNMPSEAMFQNNGMNAAMMNMNNPQDFMQMQNQWMNTMQQMQMNPVMANMMQGGMMPNMQAMMNMMQSSMGMPQMPMGMNGNQNWGGSMMPFGNQNFNTMMNNGASFNQGQQYQNFQNGNFRDNRPGNFRGGRGRNKRGGRGGFYQQHDQFNNYNSMTYPNQYGYGQGSMNNNQGPQDNPQQPNPPANDDKENDQHAEDDEFAPGGQDEVQEALGDSYKKKKSVTPEPAKVEDALVEESTQEAYQEEPTTIPDEAPVVNSPKQDAKEEYIPEAYREDLDFAAAAAPPPTAPSGPSAKDVPYRARGHGRFPSRGRGSFHGSTGYPPRSPARPVSQPQNISPSTGQAPGVVGAPTGPRAMREKDAPPPVKTLPRAESDVGFKIRGTATQSKDIRSRDEAPRSATPRSGHDDYEDRDRDPARRHSKHERKFENSRAYYEQNDDYEADHDRRRRKSRREDDHDRDMQDADYSHSRSESQDRDSSRRSGRRDRDKTRERYGSSKHKSSKRHDDETEDYDNEDDYADESSRSNRHKKSSKYEDRDERRDRDYERAEKDKHRKRSRHDRDRDDGYEDGDEEESRRRSRKYKKDHTSSSSCKDRDRDRERERDDTDLGMRITGRSNRTSEAATPTAPAQSQVDKDPHALEREARDRERRLKEQQRRENAAKSSSGLSGGRTRNVKYEDELDVRSGRGYGKSRRR